MYSDANCTTQISNWTTYSGKVYLKTSTNRTTKITCKLSGYNFLTHINYYNTTNNGNTNQPFFNLDRTYYEASKSYSVTPPSGKYHIVVKKRSTENANTKVSANFTLTRKIYGSNTTTSTPVEITNKETQKTVSFNGNSDINIAPDGYGANKPDEYTIKETSVQSGYMGLDLSGITIYVYKKLVNSTLQIDYVRVKMNGKATDIYAGTSTSAKGQNFTVTNSNDLRIEVSPNAFSIEVRNKPIVGSYTLNLVKESTDVEEYGTSGCLSGAKFDVYQNKNMNVEAVLNEKKSATGYTEFSPTTTNTKVKFLSNAYNDGDGNVSIKYDEIEDSSKNIDTYLIRENTPPTGYNLSKVFADNKKDFIALEVTKKQKNDKLIIDNITIYKSTYISASDSYYNMEIGSIEAGGSYEVSGHYNICVKLSSEGTNITFYAKDPLISGEYDLYIGKKSTENYKDNKDEDFQGSATYSVKQYLNLASEYYINLSNGKTIEKNLEQFDKSILTGQYSINTVSQDSSKLTENSITVNKSGYLYDYYVIKEEAAPTNFIIDPNTYVLLVEREVVGDVGNQSLVIKDVKIYNNDGTQITTTDETTDAYKAKTSKDTDKFKVYYTEDTITFVHADPPDLGGSYNMSIVKKDISDNSEGYENAQGGVQFEVKQYLNRNSDGSNPDNYGHTSANANCVETESGKKSDIIYGTTNTITITDPTKIDAYTIKETKPPIGYEKSNLILQFNVHKKRVGFDYLIDSVEVTNNGKSETVTVADGGSIKLDQFGNKVSNDATEYVVNIKFTETTIELIWKDYPTDQYKIKAKKVDTSNNALTGAQFKLTKGNDTTNLFENDGKVIETNEEKGYTSTYTQNVTKENVKDIDTYTLTEVVGPEGYKKLKNPLTLEITKNQTTYKLNTITIKADNGAKTQSINFATESETEKVLTGVLLNDDSTTDVTIIVDDAEIITIKAYNKELVGEYSFNIYKTVNGQPAKNINFDISGSITGNASTIANGHTRTFYRTNINKEDVNRADNITIKENVSTDGDIVGLAKSIHLEITKSENDAKTKYVIKHIKAWEDGEDTNVFESDVSETDTTTILINDVALTNEKSVTLTLKITQTATGSQHINLEVVNDEVKPKTYKLKVIKIDSITNGAVPERKFDIYKVNSDGTRELIADNITTDDDGLAKVDREFSLESAGTDQFVIQEVYEGVDNAYIKITDYEWLLNVNKVGESLSKMEVGTLTISSQLIDGHTPDVLQSNIAKGATVEKDTTDEGTVTITIPNQPEKDFSFEVRKVDLNDGELSGSKFTIRRIANGTTHPTVGLSYIDPNNAESKIVTDGVLPGETYKFYVSEKESAEGHLNLFANTSGRIEIQVKIDENGNVDQSESKITGWVNAIPEKDDYINTYLANNNKTSILEFNGNEVILNLPNPEGTTNFNFNLLKHEINNENLGVDGAEFGIRRYKVENESTAKTLDELKTIFNSGTNVETLSSLTTSKDQINKGIDSLSDVKVNTSYYYEVTESTVPLNYLSTYKKAIIRINVDKDRNINSSVIGIVENKDNADYIAYTNSYENIIKCSTSGSDVNLSWANNLVYVVTLNKKQYKTEIPTNSQGETVWSGMQGIDGATFTVKQTSPVEKTIYDHKVLSSFEFFTNTEANRGGVYTYEIQENAAKDGYYNLFEGMTIILQVTIEDDGTINKTKNATFIKIKDPDNISADKLKLAEDAMYLSVDNNKADIYIANKQIVNTFDIKILKVADKKQDDKLVGIEGVGFSILGPSNEGTGQIAFYNEEGTNLTDENGYLTIGGLEIKNSVQTYVISETSVPDGVTMIKSTQILLNVNTKGITTASELSTPYIDSEGNEVPRISYSVSPTGSDGVSSIQGLTTELIGTTVALTIPNPTKRYHFQMFKSDELTGSINGSDGNGAAQFTVSKLDDNNNWIVEHKGDLTSGFFVDYQTTKADKEYQYKIEETDAKPGYINILKGYELFVYISTDGNAIVEETIDGLQGETRYELKEKAGESQAFTKDEIISGGWISLSTLVGETTSSISLYIKNPYGYIMNLNKKNTKDTPINKATITAERITNARTYDLSYAGDRGNTDTVKEILKEIVTSSEVDNTVILNKKSTVSSEEIPIYNNIGMMPKDSTGQTWRIKETDVESPYTNILGNNSIIVQTMYRQSGEGLEIAKHQEQINGEIKTLNYYVCDENGTNVTANYIDYVDVNVEKVNGENRLIVTIKDPMKVKVRLNKIGANGEPLAGANLQIQNNDTNNTLKIENDAVSTDYFEEIVDVGDIITYSITETKSATGHVNILGDNRLEIKFIVDEYGDLYLKDEAVYTPTGRLNTNDETEILEHISYDFARDINLNFTININVKNPIQYKVKLTKIDSSENPLEGAQICVNSELSGNHYLDGKSSIEFVEEGIEENRTRTYRITELYAPGEKNGEETAYVNLLENATMILVVRADENGIISEAYSTVYKYNYEEHKMEQFNPNKFNIYTNVTDPNEDGIQTVEIKVENPTSFIFDLTKKQATSVDGTEGEIIPNTKFTVISSASGEHVAYTRASDGKIEFKESGIKAGDYTIKVYENEVATTKYVNILGENYIEININITADGKVTFKDPNEKYKICSSTGVEITDSTKLELYEKYVDVNIDQTSKINRVEVIVENPVKLSLEISKESTGGASLDNAEFSISNNISNKTITDVTKNGGLIRAEEEIVTPGIYKYEVTEIKSADKQYTNILDGYKIVLYVNVHADGYVELVKDENGTQYTNSNEKKFYIYDSEGNDISNTDKGKDIMKYVYVGASGQYQEIYINVENPVDMYIDLVKKDTEQGDLFSTRFTVYKGDKCIFSAGTVDDRVEITEHEVSEGEYEYYITEAYSGSPWYENILKDRFIKLYVKVRGNGVVQILNDESNISPGYFEIYEGSYRDLSSAKLISRDDEVYSYVHAIEVEKNADGISVIKVTVENPTKYEFRLKKKNAANTTLYGSKFTAYREDENGNIKKVLDNESPRTITEAPARAGNYIYYITEDETPGSQYVNVLEGKYMKVYVHLEANGRLYITNSKFQESDGYYEIYEGNIENRDGKKVDNSEFISVEVPDPKSHLIYGLDVNIINPIKYIMDIKKVDTLENNLTGAKFKVKREVVKTDISTKIFDGEVTEDVEINEQPMLAGNYIYYITETESPGPNYNNVLEGTYLKVYVQVDGKGKVTLTNKNFKVPQTGGQLYQWYRGDIDNPTDADSEISTMGGPLSTYVDVYLTENNNIYTINVEITNPTKVKVKVNKKIFGSDGVNLENVVIKAASYDSFVGEQTLTTDKEGNVSFIDEYANIGINRYIVTEATPAGDEFVNILKNKEILVYINVKEDGTFDIVDKNGRTGGVRYYLYDTSDPANPKEISPTGIIENCITIGQSTDNGIAQLDIKIKNPQKYKFTLQKIDKDTKEEMNGVHFDLTVTDSDNKPVTLKKADTLNPISTTDLITEKVGDVDGVISVDNILIEKSGTYKFRLHEQSTDGIFDWLYKSHEEDIVITATIAVDNGKYIIKDVSVTNGGSYVNRLEIVAGIGTGVTNERIKGKYDLKLNKVDSYTGQNLDGAVFNIQVEKDGESHTLYKSTDDVNSNEVLLPATNVQVTNGSLTIKDIRIEEPGREKQESYIIILTEITPPTGKYMLLDAPIKLQVTTNTLGEGDDEKFIVESVELIDDENHGLVTIDYDEDEIEITAKNEYFDLALRKSITSVAYPYSDDAKITEEETKDRIPNVITEGLVNGTSTTAIYQHNKQPVRVYKGQEVIYTLRVYNEGEIDGYAEEITDYLPEWLEFVDDDFNRERGWIQDEGNSKIVRTTNLSQEYGDENGVDNLLKARDKVTGDLDYREIEIKCIVTDNVKSKTIITNIAEISKSVAYDRVNTLDRDSETNNVEVPETSEGMSNYKNDEAMSSNAETYIEGQQDDDDFEKLIVEEFDLALRKYITDINDEKLLKTKDETNENNTETEQDSTDEGSSNDDEVQANEEITTEIADDTKYEREPVIDVTPLKDGTDTTATYTHPKEPVEVSVDDIITYTIEVYNEGTVDGYATLIKDTIPEGLEFVKDSEINKEYRWKLVDENDEETDDITKAKYIVSDYLSRDNGEDNIIKAFDGEKLDRKFVQVDFKVIAKEDWPKVIKNQAQISKDSDEGGKGVKDRDSTTNEWLGEDDEDEEFIRVTYMDLALRKFITGVNNEAVTNRIPQVDSSALINETGTTASYTHPKDPVLVHTTDVVTYTIRVYNEGSKDGYATGIKDDIPDGLEFLPDNETNKKYGWKLVDENDNEVTDVTKAKYVVTNYLSKDNETEEGQNLMKAFDKETMKVPDFRDVKIAFKVVEPTTSDRILINYAQISEQTDGQGKHREDRDSTPNEWKGEDDEDIEKVRVQYFDLALRKWVTKAIVIQDGQTNVTETGHHAEDDPEEVVKVDLKKSKIDSVVVKFEYQIRITNEGEIAGYAKEIKDHIPEGLVFDAADNPSWVQVEDRIITTDQLKDTLLQPGESAEVTVVLTWVNSETNMGVKVNIAEISKDYNEYGTPDIDSTPNNFVEGEDDIDDAPVMLTVKTGSEYLRYMAITLGVLAILGLSVSLIKDEVKRRK